MNFKIPRNVKTGMSFLGLEAWGMLYFLLTLLVFGGAIVLFVPFLKAQVILGILVAGVAYFSFMIDENTGSMNYTAFTDFLQWIRSDKNIEPIWDNKYERAYTIKIENKTVSKEKLLAYKLYLKEKIESGELDGFKDAYSEKEN